MEDLLLEPVVDTDGLAAALPLSTHCRQEIAALRAEVAGLRRPNLALRQQAGYWKGMPAQAGRRLAALEQEIDPLRGENRQLQAHAFGRTSEQSTARDRSHQREGETDPTAARQPRGQRRGCLGPPRRA